MPYSPTVWTDHVTMGNQVRMNNLESQYSEATQSLAKDLYTPFVVTGIATSKDGTNAKQLNVTAGTAFLKQSDGTLRRRDTSASTTNQFLTATPSTTYYLFLKNDGTWQWGTSASGPTNSLPIAQATTDASGNINVVSDQRALAVSMFTTLAGSVTIAPNVASKPALWGRLVSSPGADTHIIAAGVASEGTPRASLYTRSSDSYGGIAAGAGSSITAHLYAQASGWRTPEALTVDGALSTDGGKLTTDGSGNLTAQLAAAPGSNTAPFSARVASDTSARAGVAIGGTALGNSGYLFVSKGGTSTIFRLYTDGTNVIQDSGGFQISGNFIGPVACGIPMTRNGAATSKPLYTGTTTPTGDGVTTPATGAAWIKA